jgi:hypothetical protein
MQRAGLHRICRGYAVAGLAVPVLGLATGALLGILADPWLIASIVLTAGTAAILVLAWAVVVVMILRPGSTAGVTPPGPAFNSRTVQDVDHRPTSERRPLPVADAKPARPHARITRPG